MKLYQLSQSFNSIYDLLLDEDCDLTVMEETLQSIEGAVEVKVQSGIAMIQQLKSYTEAVEQEEKRLRDKRKTLENKLDWIKQYYKANLEAMGKEKIQTPLGTMSLQNSPESLVIDSTESIPSEYMIVRYDPNNEVIKHALKNGHGIPGCRLVRGKHLRIR